MGTGWTQHALALNSERVLMLNSFGWNADVTFRIFASSVLADSVVVMTNSRKLHQRVNIFVIAHIGGASANGQSAFVVKCLLHAVVT